MRNHKNIISCFGCLPLLYLLIVIVEGQPVAAQDNRESWMWKSWMVSHHNEPPYIVDYRSIEKFWLTHFPRSVPLRLPINLHRFAALQKPSSIDFYINRGNKISGQNFYGFPLLIVCPPDKLELTAKQQSLKVSQRKSSPVKLSRLLLVSTGIISLNWTVYRHLNDAWWEEERTRFHFYRGWRRTRGYWDFGLYDSLYFHMDKLGHLYSAKLLSEIATELSRWVGFSQQSANLIGPAISSLLLLEIEIYDGFFKEWGFSLGDFAANELGAYYPVAQKRVAFLNKINMKLSYHKSYDPRAEKYFIKDYAGMTFWFCYALKDNLPEPVYRFWPSFLNLALGYGVTKQVRGEVELYLALDVDLRKLPPHRSPLFNKLKTLLNFIHLPNLTLQITPRTRVYAFYF